MAICNLFMDLDIRLLIILDLIYKYISNADVVLCMLPFLISPYLYCPRSHTSIVLVVALSTGLQIPPSLQPLLTPHTIFLLDSIVLILPPTLPTALSWRSSISRNKNILEVVVKIGVYRQSYKDVKECWLHWLQQLIAGDTYACVSNFKVKLEGDHFFVLKKFTLEAIVQVAWLLGTKSLDTNRIF